MKKKNRNNPNIQVIVRYNICNAEETYKTLHMLQIGDFLYWNTGTGEGVIYRHITENNST